MESDCRKYQNNILALKVVWCTELSLKWTEKGKVETLCSEKNRSLEGMSYHLKMTGRYSEAEDLEMLWKCRQMVFYVIEHSHGGMEWAVEQESAAAFLLDLNEAQTGKRHSVVATL